jgi:hypothetical protein
MCYYRWWCDQECCWSRRCTVSSWICSILGNGCWSCDSRETMFQCWFKLDNTFHWLGLALCSPSLRHVAIIRHNVLLWITCSWSMTVCYFGGIGNGITCFIAELLMKRAKGKRIDPVIFAFCMLA